MTDASNPSTPTDLPLARAYRLKELPGRLAKWLDVPPGRTGVVVMPGGQARSFPAGHRQALSAAQRLSGAGAGFAAGYVPGGPFTARVKAEMLLSGDGELIDAALMCRVQVDAPERFFTEVALPRRTLPAGVVDLSGEAAHETLDACVQQYTAADLSAGLPTERLAAILLAALQPALQQQGLRLVGVNMLSFRPAARRAEIAEKAQELYERLQDAELRRKMAAAEKDVHLDDFIAQLDPQFQATAGLRAAPAGAPASPSARFEEWLQLETREGGRPWRILRLARAGRSAETRPARTPPADPQPPERPSRHRRWWLPRTLWLCFVILATLALTRIIWNVSHRLGWENPWEVLSVVWAFGLGGVLESLKALYVKREEINEIRVAEPGATFLDDLTHNNRARVDQLVRSGCKRELQHCQAMLNDLRRRIFRQGQETLALPLRDLEKRFEQAARRMDDLDFGPAPYLSDLQISRRVWEDMLYFDEELLVRVEALSEDLRRIQQGIDRDGGDPGLLARAGDRLDEFQHRFETRSRALRSAPEEMQAYRIQ